MGCQCLLFFHWVCSCGLLIEGGLPGRKFSTQLERVRVCSVDCAIGGLVLEVCKHERVHRVWDAFCDVGQ